MEKNILSIKSPSYSGAYQIGGAQGLQILLEEKPKFLHRYLMRACLGWVWVDAKEAKGGAGRSGWDYKEE